MAKGLNNMLSMIYSRGSKKDPFPLVEMFLLHK